jgi:hypothetical protein
MTLSELSNKIFEGSYSRESLEKLLQSEVIKFRSELIKALDDSDAGYSGVTLHEVFRKWMKEEPEPKAEFKITKCKENQ